MEVKMRQKLIAHLRSCLISSVVRNSMELESDVALKLMCVIDHHVDSHNLYLRFGAEPQFLQQILRFNDFASFKFYKYTTKNVRFTEALLQCECCKFIGPYSITLEHMVLNHGRHTSTELCQWCLVSNIRDHVKHNTLERCCLNYLENNQIRPDYECPSVIGDFYKLISRVADQLGVKVKRNSYRGNCDRNDIWRPFHVPTKFGKIKTLRMDVLDDMFRSAMEYFNVSLQNHVPDASNYAVYSSYDHARGSIPFDYYHIQRMHWPAMQSIQPFAPMPPMPRLPQQIRMQQMMQTSPVTQMPSSVVESPQEPHDNRIRTMTSVDQMPFKSQTTQIPYGLKSPPEPRMPPMMQTPPVTVMARIPAVPQDKPVFGMATVTQINPRAKRFKSVDICKFETKWESNLTEHILLND